MAEKVTDRKWYASVGSPQNGADTNMHAYTHARTHARTHAHTHARTHARTHTHVVHESCQQKQKDQISWKNMFEWSKVRSRNLVILMMGFPAPLPCPWKPKERPNMNCRFGYVEVNSRWKPAAQKPPLHILQKGAAAGEVLGNVIWSFQAFWSVDEQHQR